MSSFYSLSKYWLSIVISALLFIAINSSNANAVEFRGDFIQGSLVIGQLKQGQTVEYAGKKLKRTEDGFFLLGFGRDALPTAELIITDTKGVSEVLVLQVAAREYNIQKIEGVPQKTVTPAAEDLHRIKQDALSVKKARKLVSDQADFLGGFTNPNLGPVTGVYGSQRFYNGVPKSPHYGVDYAAPTGTIVKAPAAGIITFAHPDLFYSGGTLILDHGHGLSSSFLHLSEILVADGQKIKSGDPIAKVGATGRATGPHLDWRMNWLDQRVDPQLVLKALPLTR